MSTTREVLCVGEALWDRLPSGAVPGGAPMNVALRLAAFGVTARLLTRVGADADGHALLEFVRSQGLDTAFVQVDARHPTGYVDVDTSDTSAARYDIAMPVAWDFIDAPEYLARTGGCVDVLVYGSLGARHPVARHSQFCLLDAATLRVFDVNLRPPYADRKTIDELLRRADWVKLNEMELVELAATAGAAVDIEPAMVRLRDRYSLELVCVTLGADGALLLKNGTLYRQSGFPVQVVDTIGCGDAFLGTLLADLLRDRDPQAALERACAAGAIVAGHAGGNPNVTEAQVTGMLGKP